MADSLLPAPSRQPVAGSAPATDWIEEGRKHFLATRLKPAKLCTNYPTRDAHGASDEADFIRGFHAASAEWQRGGRLGGLESYASEIDEGRVAPLLLKVAGPGCSPPSTPTGGRG